MPLGTEVGLAPGDIELDDDPASPKKGVQQFPRFSAYVLWPHGWMDQDGTWYKGRPRPRPYCVRWGSSSPLKGHSGPPLLAGVYCGQTVARLSYCWTLVIVAFVERYLAKAVFAVVFSEMLTSLLFQCG